VNSYLVTAGVNSFLLAFPALFSIVNPIGSSLTFGRVTADRTHGDRLRLARRIAFYALLMLVGSLCLGSYILTFMGISLGALRIAGGLVVATRAWELLTAPDQQSARKDAQAESADEDKPIEDIAFFPLTMPFTTGPGTISVAITLGSGRPAGGFELIGFFAGSILACASVALMVWGTYSSADHLMGRLGSTGTRIVTRLVAFLLLCVGVQILCTGVHDLLLPMLLARPA
jgi:multiple antibiotic resistance protein